MERLGRFEIDADMISRAPKACLAVLRGCIPVRAELHYASGRIEYVAYADHFEHVPRGCEVPKYDVVIRDLKPGEYHVTFTKQQS